MVGANRCEHNDKVKSIPAIAQVAIFTKYKTKTDNLKYSFNRKIYTYKFFNLQQSIIPFYAFSWVIFWNHCKGTNHYE